MVASVPTAPPSPPTAPGATPQPPLPVAGDRPARLDDHGSVVRESVRAAIWNAAGVAKVTGPVEVDVADLHGTVSVGGTVTAIDLTLHGELDVVGAVRVAHRFSSSGESRLQGGLGAERIDGSGSLDVRGPLTATGALAFDGSVRAPELNAPSVGVAGRLDVPGTVTVERLELEIGADCALGRLLAASVRVRRHRPMLPIPSWVPFLSHPPPSLRVLRIEATEVDLEGVEVEFLRAERIRLGPGCHVAHYEGTIVHADPQAHVGPESRTPAPYGLTR